MNVKVKVNQKLCIGSGSCIVLASKHFAFNKKGKAEVTQSEKGKPGGSELVIPVTSAEKKQLIEAMRACPTQAITLVDENGKNIS